MPDVKKNEQEFDHETFFKHFTAMIKERISMASSNQTKSAYEVVKTFVEGYKPK